MLKRLGPWLDEHEAAFPKNPAASLAVIYDWHSAHEAQWTQTPPEFRGAYGENELPQELGEEGAFNSDGKFEVFFRVLQELSDRHILFRVLYESPDEPLTSHRLAPFHTVLLPEAFAMERENTKLLERYRAGGGEVITMGRQPENGFRGELHFEENQMDALAEALSGRGQEILALTEGEYGIAWHDAGGGRALHILNYSYDAHSHRIRNLPQLCFRLERPWKPGRISVFPEGPLPEVSCTGQELEVKNVGIYTVIELTEA